MSQALKPCPFCGGQSIHERHYGIDSSGELFCNNCHCTAINKTAWNTRPAQQVIYTNAYAEKVKEFITYKDYTKKSKWCTGHRNGGTVTQYLLPCEICDILKITQGENK